MSKPGAMTPPADAERIQALGVGHRGKRHNLHDPGEQRGDDYRHVTHERPLLAAIRQFD